MFSILVHRVSIQVVAFDLVVAVVAARDLAVLVWCRAGVEEVLVPGDHNRIVEWVVVLDLVVLGFS